jgi:hypothetical protein
VQHQKDDIDLYITLLTVASLAWKLLSWDTPLETSIANCGHTRPTETLPCGWDGCIWIWHLVTTPSEPQPDYSVHRAPRFPAFALE